GASGDVPSKLDLLTGKHTTSVIILIMFVVIVITLGLYLGLATRPEAIVITGFFTAISGLIGFFAGHKSSQKVS
ncbi:MAG: hypothetical protein ACXVC7_13310, partial [Bacteroidia bacterium]